MNLNDMVKASGNLGNNPAPVILERWFECDVCGVQGVEDEFEDGGLCYDCAYNI